MREADNTVRRGRLKFAGVGAEADDIGTKYSWVGVKGAIVM